jgi:hypothetical protein
VSGYYYSKSLIKVEKPKEDLGRKVVIELPSGEEVFTYEKLVVRENGKMYYKGDRSTIDLTGGTIIYEDWK